MSRQTTPKLYFVKLHVGGPKRNVQTRPPQKWPNVLTMSRSNCSFELLVRMGANVQVGVGAGPGGVWPRGGLAQGEGLKPTPWCSLLPQGEGFKSSPWAGGESETIPLAQGAGFKPSPCPRGGIQPLPLTLRPAAFPRSSHWFSCLLVPGPDDAFRPIP